MGRDKATLPFGPESMLQRVVRLVGDVVPVERTVVVAARDQVLPPLPERVLLAQDLQPSRGPLEGLAAGLRILPPTVEAAYVTSCDVPLLRPEFVRTMFSLLEESGPSSRGERSVPTPSDRFDIAVPRDGEHHHPLAAVYRRSVLPAVERLLEQDRLRPRFLFDEVPTREISLEELRAVDPQLDTLRNLNTFEDYQAALSSAGLGATS